MQELLIILSILLNLHVIQRQAARPAHVKVRVKDSCRRGTRVFLIKSGKRCELHLQGSGLWTSHFQTHDCVQHPPPNTHTPSQPHTSTPTHLLDINLSVNHLFLSFRLNRCISETIISLISTIYNPDEASFRVCFLALTPGHKAPTVYSVVTQQPVLTLEQFRQV